METFNWITKIEIIEGSLYTVANVKNKKLIKEL